MTLHYEQHGTTAVITLDAPPVNSLGLPLRRALLEALDRAQDDETVTAIVLTGAGKGFSGGADIREFGSPQNLAEPNLLTLIRALDDARKPVVAAIAGVCMGGGLELALGCHYRVAAPGASIALPEVKIGLVPGAGGTQRLPRVLDFEIALNMIISGDALTSENLAARPGQALFDRIVDGDLVSCAIRFAESVSEKRPLPRVRDRAASQSNTDGYFAFARATLKPAAKHLPAPLKCVDCVEAAVRRRFDDGLAVERQVFDTLMLTPQARALQHAFLADRAAAKVPGLAPDTPVRRIERVAVIGAGTMGGGIAMNFLNAGIPVAILETRQEALDRGIATVRRNYEAQVARGKLGQAACELRMALLTPTLSYADIRGADLVIEAVFEDLAVKQQVFGRLDQVMKEGAILASNTSTLDLDTIASFTKRPQDVVGLHFFSPANVMKLLEVVRGGKTANDVLATVMSLARKIRKTAVVSGVCDGFIGNRMVEQYFRQAGFLLDEGCSPQQVDQAIERWGLAMGPFRMGDLAGNDIGWAIRKRRYVEQPGMRYSATADRLCEMGRFGQKTGSGWYDYAPGKRDAQPSAAVQAMLESHRKELGFAPRRIDDEEIVQRLLYALVNEGARILDEGIAARAGDIDVVYLAGYGFPAWRGGPMHHADTQGLSNVVRAMRRFARNPHDDARFWEPAPLLARLAAESRSFS
jgi:3-hydroxyacyl-CoA dehydrogenase